MNIPGKPTNFRFDDLEDSGIQSSMQNITVYDIATQSWYSQKATGDVPSWRYNGCSVVVSAADGSSHSIYLFGGWGPLLASNAGTVYVLSIPSFIWIRVTVEETQRYRHKCHLMGKNHMLVVGGINPNFNDGRGPIDFHAGVDKCDNNATFSQGLGIFSLNNHTWTTDYDPVIGAAPYRVHPSISKVIGGNTTGGATKLLPDNGFSSDALRDLLSVARQGATGAAPSPPANSTLKSTPASPPSSRHSLSTGAIAGIAVSLTIFAVFGFGLLWFLRVRGRRKDSKANLIRASIARPTMPIEADGGPAAPEFPSGNGEKSLARMYPRHELSNATERHEMPSSLGSWELPSLHETCELPGSLGPAELPGPSRHSSGGYERGRGRKTRD